MPHDYLPSICFGLAISPLRPDAVAGYIYLIEERLPPAPHITRHAALIRCFHAALRYRYRQAARLIRDGGGCLAP